MYNLKTMLAGSDQNKLKIIAEKIEELFGDLTILVPANEDLRRVIDNESPDMLIFDLNEKPDQDDKDELVRLVDYIKNNHPCCLVCLPGVKKSVVKDKGFQELVDCFAGKTEQKIIKDYGELRSESVKVGSKMMNVLTGFFAPYLLGEYQLPGFDRLLVGTYSREENLPIIESLEKRFQLFSSLLEEENRLLIERAFKIYRERDLLQEEIEQIREEFFFQFTDLTALDNFSDRRKYYAERKVVTNVWESTIEFAREVGESVMFGCHKLADVVQLKVANLEEYDLNNITPRHKIFKTLQSIEPYGSVKISCGDQVLYIGDYHDEIEDRPSDGLTFQFCVKVMVPARRRRGLQRL